MLFFEEKTLVDVYFLQKPSEPQMELVLKGRECEGPSWSGRWRGAVASAGSPSFALCLLCSDFRIQDLAVGHFSACYKGYMLMFSSWKRPGRSLVCSSLEHSQILTLQDVSQIFFAEQPQVVQAVVPCSGFQPLCSLSVRLGFSPPLWERFLPCWSCMCWPAEQSPGMPDPPRGILPGILAPCPCLE